MMQNTQLADEVARREREAEQLQGVTQALRLELEAQVVLHSELDSRLTQQAEALRRELAAVQEQLAAATRKRGASGGRAGQSEDAEVIAELEGQLTETERSSKVLAAEKVQLLEAYELLEEDTGRLIDKNVAQQQARITELSLQLEVRRSKLCACAS